MATLDNEIAWEQQRFNSMIERSLKMFDKDIARQGRSGSKFIMHQMPRYRAAFVAKINEFHSGKATIMGALVEKYGAEVLADITMYAVLSTGESNMLSTRTKVKGHVNNSMQLYAYVIKTYIGVMDDKATADKATNKAFNKVVEIVKRKSMGLRRDTKKFKDLSTKLVTGYDANKDAIYYDASMQLLATLAESKVITEGGCNDALISLQSVSVSGKTRRKVVFSKELDDAALDRIKSGHPTMLIYPVMLVKPKDWTTNSDGGYYSEELGYKLCATKEVSTQVLEAVNRQQATPFRVAKKVFDTMITLNKEGDKIIPQGYEMGRLPFPLKKGIDYADRTEEQQRLVKAWKSFTANENTKFNKAIGKTLLFEMGLREYSEIAELEEFYIPFYLDYRGRVYPKSTIVSTQSDDLHKGLIEFAHGKLINTKGAILMYKHHGASVWGHDKLTMKEKSQWVDANTQMLLNCGTNPLKYREWQDADKPWQSLKWCIDFAQWYFDTENYLSHVEVALDGTCNGLQHIAAITRDKTIGKLVNLTGRDLSDIYTKVYKRVVSKLHNNDVEHGRWCENTIGKDFLSRKFSKRSVMTLPYGSSASTRRESVAEYVNEHGNFGADQQKVIGILAKALELAMKELLGVGIDFMKYIKKMPTIYFSNGIGEVDGTIKWTTPDNFTCVQTKFKDNAPIKAVFPRGFAIKSFNVVTKSTQADKAQHKSSISPNLIHSLDATHLRKTVNAMDEDTNWFMVHDSYACHASDATKLAKTLREQFIDLYRDPKLLTQLITSTGIEDAEFLDLVPFSGDLDLNDVQANKFFFS